MEKQLTAGKPVPDKAISLNQLVHNLVSNSLPAAMNNKSSVVNEVGQDVVVGSEMSTISGILCDLLTTVVINSRNGEIHITADRYRDVVTLEIQERNNYNGYALAYSIGTFEPDALKIGGHISIKGSKQKVTTVSFSFPSLYAA
ncbi:MAG: hypothetical protein ABIR30_15075 [Chitinophagaceae bacterium]